MVIKYQFQKFKNFQTFSGRELPFIWRTNLPALKAFLATASQGLFGKVSNLKRQSLTETTVMVDNQPLEVCTFFFLNDLFLYLAMLRYVTF